jgi:hypothetical protein
LFSCNNVSGRPIWLLKFPGVAQTLNVVDNIIGSGSWNFEEDRHNSAGIEIQAEVS